MCLFVAEVFDALFFGEFAYQQIVVSFCHYVSFQSLYHHLFLLRYMNDASR